jgi:hypothetical protein
MQALITTKNSHLQQKCRIPKTFTPPSPRSNHSKETIGLVSKYFLYNPKRLSGNNIRKVVEKENFKESTG